MKIINILNKIANGEEPPKKIVWKKKVYIYDEDDYYTEDNDDAIFDYHEITDILNDEIKILETTLNNCNVSGKKIEKLECIDIDNEYNDITDEYDLDRIDGYVIGREDERILKDLAYNILEFQTKVNEIIDCINKEE